VRAATTNPFGVNLLPSAPDLEARVDLIAEVGATVASFAGPPSAEVVARLHDLGLKVIVTVGAPRHAVKVVDLGVDAVIAQGGEGGGHTGAIATTLLLPSVVDSVGARVPVLAAGGFFDGRGLVAALAYGADGVAMGTRFLLTAESRVPDAVKQQYLAASPTDTVVSVAIDGKPQRVITTPFVRSLERAAPLRFARALGSAWRFRRLTGTSMGALLRQGRQLKREQDLSWGQVALAANAPMLTKAAMVDGRLDAGILPSGQVAGVIADLPSVADLLDQIVTEAEAALKRLGG